jgi:Yip1 domain
MSDAPTAPAPVPGLFSRLIGVIFAPKATFDRLVPSPRVFGALAVVCVLIPLAQGLPQLTERGKQAALDAAVQQTERFTGQPVTPEAYARMQATAPYRIYGTMIVGPAISALIMLFFGGLYFVLFNVIMGGTASYKQVMTIVAHAGVITALGMILGAPVQYIQGTANPTGPFSLGVLLPMLDENSFLARMLGFISVISIWQSIVTGIGLGVLYKRKAGGIVIGLLVLSVTFAAIAASIIGMFSSR